MVRNRATQIVLLMLLTVVGVACARRVHRVIDARDVGSGYARHRAYMQTLGGVKEGTPAAVRHDAVIDEVTLARHGPDETCFDVVLRTSLPRDEPLDQLRPRCILGDQVVPAMVQRELVGVVDYDYRTRRSLVRAEGLTPHGYLSLDISEPSTATFRVVERDGRVCCRGGDRHRVGLSMEQSSYSQGGLGLRVRYRVN